MKLIVFSGLPGTGKTVLAESVAREFNIPVFAKDWIKATLLRCELAPTNPEKPLGSAGYQLLTILAKRQLMLGQSVILDSVASTQTIRSTWRELAKKYMLNGWLSNVPVLTKRHIAYASVCVNVEFLAGMNWIGLKWNVSRVIIISGMRTD